MTAPDAASTAPLRTVNDAWLDYQREIVPAGAGPTQVQECRRAFYAGVAVLHAQLVAIGADETITETTAVDHLDAICAEILGFMEAVGTPLEHVDVTTGVRN